MNLAAGMLKKRVNWETAQYGKLLKAEETAVDCSDRSIFLELFDS